MTTLDDFGGVLGRLLNTFFWALTISWSWLLAHVCSGPKMCSTYGIRIFELCLLACLCVGDGGRKGGWYEGSGASHARCLNEDTHK